MNLAHHQYYGVHVVAKCGTEEAKSKYLSKLSTGEYLSAFGLLEENSLDMNMINCNAEPKDDGSLVSTLYIFF